MVHAFGQFLARLKYRHRSGSNGNGLTCLRVSALPLLLAVRLETAEPAQIDFLALGECFRDLAEHGIDHLLGVFLGRLHGLGKVIDQGAFCRS